MKIVVSAETAHLLKARKAVAEMQYQIMLYEESKHEELTAEDLRELYEKSREFCEKYTDRTAAHIEEMILQSIKNTMCFNPQTDEVTI